MPGLLHGAITGHSPEFVQGSLSCRSVLLESGGDSRPPEGFDCTFLRSASVLAVSCLANFRVLLLKSRTACFAEGAMRRCRPVQHQCWKLILIEGPVSIEQ